MSKRVMIVEDDVLSLKVMQTALSKSGLEVEASEDVAHILERARSGEIGLVVLDVALSNSPYQGEYLDGTAIARLLKGDEAARGVPILLTTAYAMRGDEERLLAASGADGYLSKPFPETCVLLERVQ